MNWYLRAPEALDRTAVGESLLDPTDRDAGSRLAGTGGAIWRLLETPRTLADLVETLAEQHRVPSEEIAPDVERFLQDLLRRGWVQAVADGDD